MQNNTIIDFKKLFNKTKDLSLLLVEDYAPLRDDMTELLEDLFKTVIVASNGVEALKLYREYKTKEHNTFDIVISDIEMPIMNGVDLCEILKKENENQTIIILSAHTDSKYLLRLINLGIAQFINKPIQDKQLMSTLFDVSKKISKKENQTIETTVIDLGENVFWYKKKLVLQRDRYPVSLTRHEILLMQLMSEKIEKICTNDDIMHYFYLKGVDLDEKNIRNLIFKLRKKLPNSAVNSIYGMGYKLTAIL